MYMPELNHRLLKDVRAIGINENFNLVLKPYSKMYYGRYNPNNSTIIIYVHKDPEAKHLYSYRKLLMTLIHESVHCIQWNSDSYVRLKGVMHNPEFYKMYNKYSDKAKTMLLKRGDYN